MGMKALPSLKALRALEAVLRQETVHAAAQELHVTDGAVSQQLRRLESELGRPLFKRTGRVLTPTRETRELGAVLTDCFGMLGLAADSFKKQKRSGPLQIAILPSIATRLVVPALSEFRSQAPDVWISFTYAHSLADFSFATADLLICFVDGPYVGPGVAHVILDGSVRPVCSPTYRRRLPDRVSPQHLQGAELLHDTDHQAWLRWFRESGANLRALPPGDVYEDFGLLGAAALAGHGVALCPVQLVGEELARGELVVVSNTATLTERRYCVIVPEAASPDALTFANWVKSLRPRGLTAGARSCAVGRPNRRAHSPRTAPSE